VNQLPNTSDSKLVGGGRHAKIRPCYGPMVSNAPAVVGHICKNPSGILIGLFRLLCLPSRLVLDICQQQLWWALATLAQVLACAEAAVFHGSGSESFKTAGSDHGPRQRMRLSLKRRSFCSVLADVRTEQGSFIMVV
jgi:hypothetical protein